MSRKWVSSVFEQIRTTDEGIWTNIQQVSGSPTFWADHNWWEWPNMSSMWVALHCLNISEPLMRTWCGWTHDRVWVALLCLNYWWEGWICIQGVSCSSLFEQIKTTYEYDWMCIQQVSCSPLFEQFRPTNKNGWICIQRVSYSLVFELTRTTYENGWTCI